MQVKSFQERCSDRAKASLKSVGIEYPLYDSSVSAQTNYKRMIEYRLKESALIVEYMASAPKLVIERNDLPLKPIKTWGKAYND